jgi:hypothetical protein
VKDSLGHFVVSLSAIAKALKRKREEQAELHRKWEAERKQQAEQAARKAEYERRAKAVEILARSWDQSKSLQAFAEKLSSQAGHERVPEEQRQDIRAMAEWTRPETNSLSGSKISGPATRRWLFCGEDAKRDKKADECGIKQALRQS